MKNDKDLILAWHGPETMTAIGRRLGMKLMAVRNAYKRLEKVGRIPGYSREHIRRKLRPHEDDDHSISVVHDRLLERLIKVHGNDRRFD